MMMQAEHEIVSQVLAAKQDSSAADEFIQKYMGFIHSETTKFLHRAAGSEHEDEFSIAMFAFYEAIINYQRGKGAFLSYAARAIRNRLIDYYRKEKRHTNTISIHTPTGIDGESELADTLRDEKDELHQAVYRQATQAEIQEFAAQLGEFGVSLSGVAQNSPKQQRTLQACCRILDYAKQNPHLLVQLVQTKRLPMAELSEGTGVDKKTMERHRKYLVAILLAFTNGYEIIRGHLCQMNLAKGDEQA